MRAASVAMVGGADGPMVLFTSLILAKHLFVPITVVAYLYLGLTYGGYPYLVKLLIPQRLRAIKMTTTKPPKNYDAKVKLAFSVILCAVLCFLFPVASPLFFHCSLGVAVRESGMKLFMFLSVVQVIVRVRLSGWGCYWVYCAMLSCYLIPRS